MKLQMIMICGALTLNATAGKWGRAPNGEFWNAHAKRFIYAPAFDFGAQGEIEYTVMDDYHCVHKYRAQAGTAIPQDVWQKLPIGFVTVMCNGKQRTFWKKSPFTGNYAPRKRSYALARNKIFDYFFELPQTHYLAKNGKPDLTYPLNGYPSKMLASEINAICAYTKQKCSGNDTIVAKAQLNIARKAADFLIAEAVPAGAPLEFFTRTYAKEGSEYGRFKGEQDTIMLIYPALAGSAFINLYKSTKEEKYLAAAERIAATFIKLQGDDGTWFLKQNCMTGKETAPNRLMPGNVIAFMENLFEATGKTEYRACGDRAFKFIEDKSMRDWNWEGQFEDVAPVKNRWGNLSKHQAGDAVLYMLKRFKGDEKRLAQAREIVKFCEDQFVEWTPPYTHGAADEPPYPDDGSWNFFCKPYREYVTPCALEQYKCYHPIDASASKMIFLFTAMYDATHDKEYLAKARALGDTATRMQEDDGFICTWWMKGVQRNDNRYHTWLNCLLSTARALNVLSKYE